MQAREAELQGMAAKAAALARALNERSPPQATLTATPSAVWHM